MSKEVGTQSESPIVPAARAGCIWRTIVLLWKYLVGALFCGGLIPAVMVVGWSLRLVQRHALSLWWEKSPRSGKFQDFIQAHGKLSRHSHWPNWFLRQNFLQTRRELGLFRSLFHSLWTNIRIGSLGIFNTWVLTAPSGLLWVFAWYSGWDNSFNKGYEQFWVGPTTAWIGIIIYIAVMLYLPAAQARQAVTGNWRAFYDFALIRKIVKRRRLAFLVLAGLYSAVALPAFVMRIAPAGFGLKLPAEMTHPELVNWLQNYYLYCSFYVFPAYVFLRLAAGRIYANAMAELYEAGEVRPEELDAFEQGIFREMDLPGEQAKPAGIDENAKGCVGFFMRPGIVIITSVFWFSFVAQIFVAQFVSFDPIVTWINQPLVQIPAFEYVPAHLKGGVRGTEFPFMLAAFWLITVVTKLFPRRD
ncbi:MAG: hypothetical protein O3B01_10115 [Planctomycetota bacterium]|nr:hypothetical protein [Planctomycetota bacterium]MDA1138925.1 hypothetical protein [Planctomycetota bacterium]